MKKILTTILLLSFFMTGCSNTKNENNVAKVDKTKDYIYTSNYDELNLEQALTDAGRGDVFNESFKTPKKLGFLDYRNDQYTNQKIHVNINSDDARQVEDHLILANEFYEHLRQQGQEQIKMEDGMFYWGGLNLYDSFIDKKSISFISYGESFVYPGHIMQEVSFYSFDKESGDRYSDKEFLEILDIDLTQVKDTIQEDFKTLELYENSGNPILVENVDNLNADVDDKLYLKIIESYSLVIKNNKLLINMLAYSQLDGDFTMPYIHEISLDKFK